MQDQEQTPRPAEVVHQTEPVFTSLMNSLEATREEHGAVTFGSARDEHGGGDTRAVIFPEPVVDEEAQTKTYVAATRDGVKGIVFEGDPNNVSDREASLKIHIAETDRNGGKNTNDGLIGSIGYAPLNGGILTGTSNENGRFFASKSEMLSVPCYVTDVSEDVATKAYDGSVVRRKEIRAGKMQTSQAKVQTANALLGKLGPK